MEKTTITSEGIEFRLNEHANTLDVSIPLTQKSYDALGGFVGHTDNLIGIIDGDEFSISKLIDLGYKGTQQEGGPILLFNSSEDLIRVCKMCGITYNKIPQCAVCEEGIRGVSYLEEEGFICSSCFYEKNESREEGEDKKEQ